MPRTYTPKPGKKRRCGSHPQLEEAMDAIGRGKITRNVLIKYFFLLFNNGSSYLIKALGFIS